MFTRYSTWCGACAAAFLLSACGGGDPGAATETAAAITAATTATAASAAAAVAAPVASFQSDSAVLTMHGGGASVITSAQDNPALASDAERQAMELSLVEYEKSYSIEMNRLHDEQVAREKAAEAGQRATSLALACADQAGADCAKTAQ